MGRNFVMIKKGFAKLIALTLTLSCLTACAGSGAGTAASGGSKPAESTTAEAVGSADDQSAQPAGNTAEETAEDPAADPAAATSGTESAEDPAAAASGTEAAEAPAAAATGAEAAEETPIDYTTGTPWPDIDLEGVVTPDMTADIRDNYALAVNKDKILALEIPEGRSYGGTIMDLDLQESEDVKSMFLGDAPEEHDARLAYDLFWLMMDWDSPNALGIAPLKEMTDKVEAISTIDELMAYHVETPAEKQLDTLWDIEIDPKLNDSSRNIILLSDSGLLLEDSAEYRKLTPYGKTRKEALTTLAKKMLVKLGYSEEEAVQKTDNCFAFETMLADSIYTLKEQQEPDFISRINNIYSREDLEKLQGKLPILASLEEGSGYPAAEEYQVAEPANIEKLNELCVEENLPLIRDMFIVRGVINCAAALDRECYEWSVECNNAISGSTGILDDETAFSGRVARTLVWPVARLYTETYLKQEDKDRISAMVDEILDAYHGILESADFLSDETRAKAVEKLEAIEKFILYPDDWSKYSCEELDFSSKEEGGSYWDALEAIAGFNLAKRIKDYSEPVDKEKWEEAPHTVNCFYNPQVNGIYIMGAFARSDFYNSEMSEEELYGGLGTAIGHEISHAFDSKGAQFDKNGDMSNWWTEEDYAKFLERNEKMVAYYNAMHPWEGQDFHGSIMTGEACADMAGVKVMLQIAADHPDFDYDKFFRTFANNWLTKDSLQQSYVRINDVHPMCYLRINATLQQFDEFLNFYGITEGDNMYLAPEDRVAIW